MYTLGICAMDKKARSKPMMEILKRLPVNEFKVVIFGDDKILNVAIEEWPVCDVLIAFHSKVFPLKKSQQYVTLRKPILVNNLDKQNVLLDRRDVYKTLTDNGRTESFPKFSDHTVHPIAKGGSGSNATSG